MTTKAIRLTNRDGLTIRANLHLPEGDGPHPLVLVAHGFKGFKDWGFFPHLAESLAAGGLAALRFDFARNGVDDDISTFARLDLFEENSMTREIADLEDVVGALPDLDGVDRLAVDRLGLVGHSRGGGVAVLFAAGEPRIRSLTTWAGVARFNRYFQGDVLTTWKAEGVFHVENSRTHQLMPLGMDLYRDLTDRLPTMDVVAAEERLAIPHLIVHGDADEAVPAEDGPALEEASGGRAKLLLIPGAGHTFGAVHPFAGTTPHLDLAVEATVSHFRETL